MLNWLLIKASPDIQHRYTMAEQEQFEALIAKLKLLQNRLSVNSLIQRTLTDKQQERFFQYCDDLKKKHHFRQACLDCHEALSIHANYLKENLEAGRKPEGDNTEAMLEGLLERRESLLGNYARHVFDDISQSVEQRSASRKSKPK